MITENYNTKNDGVLRDYCEHCVNKIILSLNLLNCNLLKAFS